MPEKEVVVFIYLPDEIVAVPAGIFSHDPDLGVGNFAYGRRYLQRENARAVDPVALPLGSTPNAVTTNGGIYGAFRDAAPDYWGRLVIAAAGHTRPEALSELDFLLGTNATRTGNLDFRTSPRDPEPILSPPHFNQLADVVRAARHVESGEAVQDFLMQLLRQGSSMGGARPKSTVEWNDALWIAKFNAKNDTVNIPRIEYATMTLAGRCGILVPPIEIVTSGGKDIFCIKRFDREKSGQGWLRTGYLSSLSLMRQDEHDRLHWSYPLIASIMRRYCQVEDIAQLFRRMVFNILVRNTDDHPRNHGFLVKKSGLSLSPAFDIVPSMVQKGVSSQFSLAMAVGESGRDATLENALSQCGQFGLSKREAREIIGQCLDTQKRWRHIFRDCGVSRDEIEILAPSFEGS